MIDTYSNYILAHEYWLTERILSYAKKTNFTQHTSTLLEAWILSIRGLSASMVDMATTKGLDVELTPDDDYTSDPATRFGALEAQRHRERGIRLGMFLGLMKYYRQTYTDLFEESTFPATQQKCYGNLINRFFDRMEISFCTSWVLSTQGELLEELQAQNRKAIDEKNKYLTIFESLASPVFIVAPDGRIENMNLAASNMFFRSTDFQERYYADSGQHPGFAESFPWLARSYEDFLQCSMQEHQFDLPCEESKRHFNITFSRPLDVSDKHRGVIVKIQDMTQRKEMERELETLASTDPLTGTMNRRAFLGRYEYELERCSRYGCDLSILMLDIDYFKNINDTHGHDTGDRVLKILVNKVGAMLRNTDIMGRWGGEEFIIMLPNSPRDQALNVAEKLRDSLAQIEVATDQGIPVALTVSIGLATYGDESAPQIDLIKLADQALYQAKEQGRNRVVVVMPTIQTTIPGKGGT